MRVRVAVDASVELDPRVFDDVCGSGGKVTLLAHDLRMHAGQRVFCFRMIELFCLFPVVKVRVAAFAIRPELPFMRIRMARSAVLGQTEIGPVQICQLYERLIGGNHVRGAMAFLAGDSGVFFH